MRLTITQTLVLQACLEGKTYQEIADLYHYSHEHVRIVGAKLWRQLSAELNRQVNKSNVAEVLSENSL